MSALREAEFKAREVAYLERFVEHAAMRLYEYNAAQWQKAEPFYKLSAETKKIYTDRARALIKSKI